MQAPGCERRREREREGEERQGGPVRTRKDGGNMDRDRERERERESMPDKANLPQLHMHHERMSWCLEVLASASLVQDVGLGALKSWHLQASCRMSCHLVVSVSRGVAI